MRWNREQRGYRCKTSSVLVSAIERKHEALTDRDPWGRQQVCPSAMFRSPVTAKADDGLISDLPRGIYVVPQKRAGGRYGSPSPVISSASLGSATDNRPSGHENGFFPLGRRTARALLTPTAAAIATGAEGQAWGPGCLYVDDPPDDEGGLAEVWWERLKLTSPVGASGCVKHASDGPSWRDRYENDPASRRFMSVHRRAMTHG